ncbi:restriction endonuclease subunit S [Akkermansiaceae bacterium]|nr:restriction endonuclease subunit S [Akkermansiaceae bacterium]
MSWGTVQIGTVCEIVSGATPRTSKPEYWNGEVKWVTPKDLSNLREKHISDTPRKITRQGLNSCAAKMLPPQSVLLSCRAPIGLVAINTEPVCTNQGFKSLVPKANQVDPNYLYWWLLTNREYLDGLGRGATFKEISKSIIQEIDIPLPHRNGKPDLNVQKRIAAILDKADAIRRKLQQSLRLSDDFLRSVFLDMFGDPEGNGWEIKTIEDVLAPRKGAIRTGPFGSNLLHSEFVDEGIAVLGIDNAVQNKFAPGKPRFITEEKYQSLKHYTVYPGDVLITIMGTCGRCAIVPEDIPTAINTKHLCCISLDRKKCLPEFLHSYFLLHPMAKSYLGQTAKGAIMDGLSGGVIKRMPIPEVPMSLQKQYAKLVKNRTALVDRLTNQLAESEDLFSSLQQRAFRGEL